MNNLTVMKNKVQNLATSKAMTTVVLTAALVGASAFPALAAEVDIAAKMAESFQATADTMIATIFAALPVVMSVMSAYLCINFGLKFFKRTAK